MSRSGLNNIIKAAGIAVKALRGTVGLIRPGVSERRIAKNLYKIIRASGGDGFSFVPIVASGSRSANPHGRASGRIIRDGDIVMVDFGVRVSGYRSDITRTFVAGKPSKRQKFLYKAIKDAQSSVLKMAKPGAVCKDIDLAARNYLTKKGLDKYFIHSTGHGVGKRIHQAPKIGRKNRNKLKPGMVITIEPGVYFKGWGGMRVEDMFLITRSGARLLTKFPRELGAR